MAGKHQKKGRRFEKSPKPSGPLQLRNPHAVLAALESRPDDVIEIRIDAEKATPAWAKVVIAAQENRRPVKPPIPPAASGKRHSEDLRATLATALVQPKPEDTLNDLLECDEETGVWLALEHVQDPHNVGAIVRTAAFFGVRGLILTKDQSAALTPIAYDIAAGGVEAIPHCTVTNLSRTIDAARDAGLWTLGTSEHAEQPISAIETDRKWLVIVGNEEAGLRRLTREKCDAVVAIPCRGSVTSLNVSVATGIVLSRLAE